MTLQGSRRPFCALAMLALALSGPASLHFARAETAPPGQIAAAPMSSPTSAQPATPPDQSPAPAAPAAPTSGTAASGNPSNPPPQKTLAARAIDTVKQAAKSASGIFS